MPQPLLWTDAEDLGILLFETKPDIHPLSIRFADLRTWVMGLEEFGDNPAGSNEGRLEQIQMAWWEEWKDEHGDALP